MEEYVTSADEEMGAALEHLSKELGRIRTGRATPRMLDSVVVEVASYGASMPLQQLATVQAADARLLVVTPWDKSTLTDVERAIVAANLGLNPSNDGQVVRVPVPPLTQERRQQLVKQAKALGEDIKVRIRHVRREYNDTFKTAESDGEITEDDLHRFLGRVQELTDGWIAKVDTVVEDKEKEILEV